MSFFLEIKSNTVKCPNGCKLFNDKRNFSYYSLHHLIINI